MTKEEEKKQAVELLSKYAALFWQCRMGNFDEQTFADHEGIARSVRDTLECCQFDLERVKAGNVTGLNCAVRDLLILERVLK